MDKDEEEKLMIHISQAKPIDTTVTTNNKTTRKISRCNNYKINKLRTVILILVLLLNLSIFLDRYEVFKDSVYIKDLIKSTLSVMGIHLVIEHILENLICKFNADSLILYSSTACIRDIINNITMTLFYIFDDYAYWWLPMMWGCYMADLVMLLSKWRYFKTSWLKFVFFHHFGVGVMLLILNHTTKYFTEEVLLSIIIYMNSDTAGCLSPIWKSFECPLYKYSTLICFILQRIDRFTSYIVALMTIKLSLFFEKDYNYIVIIIFGLALDFWDIYGQTKSMILFYHKQKQPTQS